MNDFERSANKAMWLAIAGLFTCCAPIGIAALIWALFLKRDAEAANQPVPARVWIALVLGGLSVVEMGAAFVYGKKKQAARAGIAAAATARLEGKRAELALKHDVACDLVVEYLLATEARAYDEVICPGQVEAREKTATLTRVDAITGSSTTAFVACFARTDHWFVINAEKSGVCPSDLPPLEKATDAELRVAITKAGETAIINTFTTRMIDARTKLAAHKHKPTACTSFAGAGPKELRLEIGYVDYDDLNAATARTSEAWKFMTKDDVRDALNHTAANRVRAIKDVGRYLAVFHAEKRRWPEMIKKDGVISDDFSYVSGGFDGWVSIVDLETTTVVCEGRFSFENSEKIRYRKGKFSSEQGSVEKALKNDFEEQFEDIAAASIRELALGQLKLGVKLLE